MPRLLGIDWGRVRLGLAVSDETGLIAQGLPSLQRTGLVADMTRICQVASEWGVAGVVLGLPRNMDGSSGPAALEVEGFAQRLRERAGVPVHLWDERLTTLAAERTLIEAGVRRRARRSVVDQVAATMILQSFLDRQRAGASPPTA